MFDADDVDDVDDVDVDVWGWDKHSLPLCMCGIGAGTCKSGAR